MKLLKITKFLNHSLAGKVFLLAFLFLSLSFNNVSGQMTGTTYKIPLDSINVGGGEAGGTSYNILDTIGEVGTGDSAGTIYKLSDAGFIGAQQIYMAISSPSDVNMSPNISGVSGGTGDGQASWTVTTDNPSGYEMTIEASTSPALEDGAENFADYTTGGPNPTYDWTVASSDSEFGFTPEGVDVNSRYLDDGVSACNTGSSNTVDKCWDSLDTVGKIIATRISSNHTSGTSTTVKFRAEVGANKIQPNGTYTATVTVTVLPR